MTQSYKNDAIFHNSNWPDPTVEMDKNIYITSFIWNILSKKSFSAEEFRMFKTDNSHGTNTLLFFIYFRFQQLVTNETAHTVSKLL